MLPQAVPVALLSAAVFGGLSLMSDRPRGAAFAQGILVIGAILVFIAIAIDEGLGVVPPDRIAAYGVGLMAAAVSAMLYHLYLGRFGRVWTARVVFLLVYLVVSALFGLVFLSLI
jgi:hypothetical protein